MTVITRVVTAGSVGTALSLLADSPHGCTESIMMAHGCAIGVLRDLVRDGLATANRETVVAGRRRIQC